MQSVKLNQSTASLRRVYFVAVDSSDYKTRLTSGDMSTFTLRITKNGGTDAAPSSTTVTEVGSTNMAGLFFWEGAQADFDTAGVLVLKVTNASGSKVMVGREIHVKVGVDTSDTVRGGMTALPNANAEAAGGLYTRGSGAGQINQAANGQVDTNTVAMANNVVTAAAVANGAIDFATYAQDALDLFRSVRRNTAQAGAAGTITLDASASATDNFYNGCYVYIYGGTGIGQTNIVRAYVGSTKVATLAKNWITNPDATSTFIIFGNTSILEDNSIPATALATGAITSAKFASGAITSTVLASGAITSTVIASNAIGATQIASAAITLAKFATGAIDNTILAAGAISRSTLAQDAKDMLAEVRRNTAQAGAAGTITLDASASATDNFYNGCIILLVGGTGSGQTNRIRSYVGSTKVATLVKNWVTNPDATSVFELFGYSSLIEDAAITSNVFASGAITATAIASNAITTAKFAAGAIDSTILAAGAITSSQIAANAIGATQIASAAITLAKFGSGAIDSTVLAAGAITASVLADNSIDRATFAQDAKDMFREFRRNTAQAGAAGTITLDAGASAVDHFYEADLIVIVGGTGSGQARAISGYVGSTKVATISPNWATNPDNTSVFIIFGDAASASGGGGGPSAAVIAAAVWDEPLAGHTTAGTSGKALGDLTAVTLAAVADAVWDELLSGHTTTGSAGKALSSGPNPASIAAAVWDEDLSTHTTPGTAGPALSTAETGGDPSVAAAAVWNELLAGHTTTGSAAVALSGASTPAAVAAAVWNEPRGAHTAVGSFGEGVPVTSVATDAVSSAAVSAAAVTKIQTGLATGTNLATAQTAITAINTKLGTPAGASVSADVAAVTAKLGTPNAGSVSADVAAVKSDTASVLSQATSIASTVADLQKAALGRWKIQGTQLIMYQGDNTTPFKVFDLKDDTGSPSNTRIFERVPTP